MRNYVVFENSIAVRLRPAVRIEQMLILKDVFTERV